MQVSEQDCFGEILGLQDLRTSVKEHLDLSGDFLYEPKTDIPLWFFPHIGNTVEHVL